MTHAEHLTEVTTLDTFYENSMENDELHRKKYPIENIYKIHYCATRLWYTKPDLYYGRQINKSSLVSSIIAKCDKNTTPVCNRTGATTCDTEDLTTSTEKCTLITFIGCFLWHTLLHYLLMSSEMKLPISTAGATLLDILRSDNDHIWCGELASTVCSSCHGDPQLVLSQHILQVPQIHCFKPLSQLQ